LPSTPINRPCFSPLLPHIPQSLLTFDQKGLDRLNQRRGPREKQRSQESMQVQESMSKVGTRGPEKKTRKREPRSREPDRRKLRARTR